MKTAILHGPLDLRLDDVERPPIEAEDILIKVERTGICGTDLHFRHMGTRFGEPMPLGHEFAGTVTEAGDNVTSYAVGDRVAYNSNNSPADMGRGGECGGFGEYVVLRDIDSHPQSLCPVPDNVSLDHAALVEPLSVAMHAVNRADPKPGESVAVFGVGPIGLGIIAALKMRGVKDIVAFDLSKLRRDRAVQLGAKAAFDPRDKPPAEVLSDLRGTGKIWNVEYPLTDIYFEVSGAKDLLSDIATFCNKRSRIIMVAMQRHPVTFDGTRLMSKEVSLVGASGYPTEFPEVMAMISTGKIDPEAMITHRLPFQDFINAFEVADNADEAAKVLLTLD